MFDLSGAAASKHPQFCARGILVLAPGSLPLLRTKAAMAGRIKCTVKPVAGTDKYNVEVEKGDTVLEVKEHLAPQCNIPAAEQRLIFKGQILKDERTLDSYGRPAHSA